MKLRALTTNILGVLIIVGLAIGLSVVALAKPSLNWEKPAVEEPKPVEVPQPQPEPAPVVAPEPEPEPEPQPVVRTATTKSFVRLRRGPSTTTDILAELQGGTTVTLMPDANSLWQQVRYGNLTGYIYRTYLQY